MAENILAAACESETRKAAKRMRLEIYQSSQVPAYPQLPRRCSWRGRGERVTVMLETAGDREREKGRPGTQTELQWGRCGKSEGPVTQAAQTSGARPLRGFLSQAGTDRICPPER